MKKLANILRDLGISNQVFPGSNSRGENEEEAQLILMESPYKGINKTSKTNSNDK